MRGSEYWPASNLDREAKLAAISFVNSLVSLRNKAMGMPNTSCCDKAAAMMMAAFKAPMLAPNVISLHKGKSTGSLVAVSPSAVTSASSELAVVAPTRYSCSIASRILLAFGGDINCRNTCDGDPNSWNRSLTFKTVFVSGVRLISASSKSLKPRSWKLEGIR